MCEKKDGLSSLSDWLSFSFINYNHKELTTEKATTHSYVIVAFIRKQVYFLCRIDLYFYLLC